MLNQLIEQYSAQVETFHYLIIAINSILHVLFAGAVAKDAGYLNQQGLKPVLVSAATWAFATLVGGIITASIYWFIHHSMLTRPNLSEKRYD